MIRWQDIPGFFDFEDIYVEAVRTAKDGDTLVEVGSLFGRSAVFLAEQMRGSGKSLKFYSVDLWKEWSDVIFDRGTYYRSCIDAKGSLFGAYVHYVEQSGLRDYIRVLRMDSVEAAGHFTAVHFVFIDADHTEEGCGRDIDAWLPKMKQGGIIAGHDYNWPGVKAAVDKRFDSVQVRGYSWYKQV